MDYSEADRIHQIYDNCHPRANTAIRNDNNMPHNLAFVRSYIGQLTSSSRVDKANRHLKLLIKLAGRKYDFTYITEKEIMEILCMIQVSKQESGVYLWVNTVRHFFDYCISQGVRPDNPLEKIKIQNPFYKSKK